MQKRRMAVGNWKMHLTTPEGVSLVKGLLPTVEKRDDLDVVVCPSYTLLSSIWEVIRTSSLMLGAQDVFWEPKGAYTGQVSARMLLDAGCLYCIVGHSEKRGRFGKSEIDEATLDYFSDTDETINKKVSALLYNNLLPILCVGETDEERSANKTEEVVQKQLLGALHGMDASEISGIVIAYEPVWAIGTGNVCKPDEAERMCNTIRDILSKEFSEGFTNSIRVLYGGSVNGKNCKDLSSMQGVDGFLVGGASLITEEFLKIINSV